jgi:hypothetical protein
MGPRRRPSLLQGNVAERGSSRSDRRRPKLTVGNKAKAVVFGLVTGCAQLLDLPSEPQVVEAPEPTLEGQAMTGGESPGSDIEALAGAVEAPVSGASDEEREVESTEESGVTPIMGGVGGGAGEVTASSAADSSGSGGAAPAPAPAPAPATASDAGIPPVDPPRAPCGSGQSLGPNGRCYIAEATLLSWSRARASCRERGTDWDLASVRDPAVNRFMAELTSVDAWIGASDAQNEGRWVWVDDGTPFWTGSGVLGRALNDAFENWNSDEPNGGVTSDCARLRFDAAGAIIPTWGDFECDERLASVCEGPPL